MLDHRGSGGPVQLHYAILRLMPEEEPGPVACGKTNRRRQATRQIPQPNYCSSLPAENDRSVTMSVTMKGLLADSLSEQPQEGQIVAEL
jgi:hypothetical protein